jgi:hypothetical protein
MSHAIYCCAECRYAEYRYAECRSAHFNTDLNVGHQMSLSFSGILKSFFLLICEEILTFVTRFLHV